MNLFLFKAQSVRDSTNPSLTLLTLVFIYVLAEKIVCGLFFNRDNDTLKIETLTLLCNEKGKFFN